MKTFEEVADKWMVRPSQVRMMKDAMCEVWNMIGGDYMAACGGELEAFAMFTSEAELIAEAVVDADRLSNYTMNDMSWVYNMPHGSRVLPFAIDAWNCQY